jgi:hypothetical protein
MIRRPAPIIGHEMRPLGRPRDRIVDCKPKRCTPACPEPLAGQQQPIVRLDYSRVSAPVGKEGFQYRLSRSLMQAMLRWSSRGGESFFEKRDANAFHSSHFFQRFRRPRLALDHFSEQGKSYRDDLAILSQASDG